MCSLGWLFTIQLIEKIIAAPNKHTWIKLYKMLAVLDKASRLEVQKVLRHDKWKYHAHGSSGLFEPLVQRSFLPVPLIQILRTRFEDVFSEEHDNSISWKSVKVEVVGQLAAVELRVSDVFRWADDTKECDEIDYYQDEDSNRVFHWHDSFCQHDKHVIVVQMSFQMPRLVQVPTTDIVHDIPTGLEGGLRYVPGQLVDLSSLPVVFRKAAGLTLRYCSEEEYPAWEIYSYRRYVIAPATITVRGVWDAVANAEGWETSCGGIFAWHFPNLAPDKTVVQYFDAMEPPEDTGWLVQSEASKNWQNDGKRTLHLSWKGSNYRNMHSDLHPHHGPVTGV